MKFSIVTPSFNQLSWLDLAIRSVADQIHLEAGHAGSKQMKEGRGKREVPISVEHIIQDGGSEGFSEFAEQIKHSTKNKGHSTGYQLQMHSEADNGMYDAINKGLKRASGDICAWLNCDEQYLPGALQRVAVFFRDNPEVQVVFGDALLIGEYGDVLSYRKAVLPFRSQVRLVHLNTLSCATFFRREIVEEGHLLPTEWRAIGDAVWMENMLRAGISMRLLGWPTSLFQFTGENLGASSVASEERKKWANGEGAPAPFWRPFARLRLFLNKLFAGAYLPRLIETAYFTPESKLKRKQVNKRWVWFFWPQGEYRGGHDS